MYTCFSSDFFLEEADGLAAGRVADDTFAVRLSFFIVTKRILRSAEAIPSDWGDGYENVTICCTVENRRRAAERLPYFLSLPILHKQIICEPLLERINLLPWLGPQIEQVLVGGESGRRRACATTIGCLISARSVENGV